MNAQQMIEAAQKQTGLDTFDSDSFLEPLELAVRCIDDRPEHESIAMVRHGFPR